MKTAISINDVLFDRGEALAARLRISRSELYARALEAFLKSHRHDRVQETLDEVYQAESFTLDPVLERLQANVLPEEDW